MSVRCDAARGCRENDGETPIARVGDLSELEIPRVNSEIHALLEGRRTVVDQALGPVHSKIIFFSPS